MDRLLSVEALDLAVAPNGDQVYWLAVGVRCRVLRGEATVGDDESVEVGWFDPASVPPLPPHQQRCLSLALADDAVPWLAGCGSVQREGDAAFRAVLGGQ